MDKNRQTGSSISPPDSFFSKATDRDCANHIRSLGRFDRGRGGGLQAALAILADALEAREASPPAVASALLHNDLSDADSEAGLAAMSRTERLLHTQLTLALRLVPPLQAEVWRLKGWAPALNASAPSVAANPAR